MNSPSGGTHTPYLDEALDWLLPDGALRILDLGAGTGRLTRRLHDRGLDVVAVDPSAAMLTELRRGLPDVPAHQGAAEEIPLPDRHVDVVLMTGGRQWDDAGRALKEIARVLTPGGRLGLIHTARDERTDWVARLGEIIGSGPGPESATGPLFGPAERASFRWEQQLTSGELITLVGSRSHMILLPADERAAVLAQVRQLIATHPALLGRDGHTLPYVTVCTRTTLR
ncbi:class I SAM-dependent methyltransferase [Actinoplanes sichuanensis]|uniref:Class I SAM-dependent methyltransferase n=1 Tax=Actinoplanes sichuanensis TaxID=512349 RepID=A0ABW4A5G5_9ACTN|nr:class I SAM-dependent methyltransferase [Actinoplanes sichuanensis]BEL02829.1 class I SAM-dependent methyltransferase [Actinoplanes sichuanensis]